MRLAATFIVWAAFTFIVAIFAAMIAAANYSVTTGGGIILMIVFLALMITVSNATRAIWTGQAESDALENRRAKAKRRYRGRVERLLDDLDDEEVYDLQALLLGRDQPARLHHD